MISNGDDAPANGETPAVPHAVCPFCGAQLPEKNLQSQANLACTICGVDPESSELATFIPPRGPLARLVALLLLAIIGAVIVGMLYAAFAPAAASRVG